MNEVKEGEIVSEEERNLVPCVKDMDRSLERNKQLLEELRRRGLRVKNVLGDGNCFFRAVSYCRYNTENDHLSIRREVCEFLVSKGVKWE